MCCGERFAHELWSLNASVTQSEVRSQCESVVNERRKERRLVACFMKKNLKSPCLWWFKIVTVLTMTTRTLACVLPFCGKCTPFKSITDLAHLKTSCDSHDKRQN